MLTVIIQKKMEGKDYSKNIKTTIKKLNPQIHSPANPKETEAETERQHLESFNSDHSSNQGREDIAGKKCSIKAMGGYLLGLHNS